MGTLKRVWISDRIRELGKKKKDLAEALGLPHTRISDIVNGTRALKVTEVKPFADFMNMSFDDVLRRFSEDKSNDWPSYDTLGGDERNMVETYRGLSESGKQKFQEFLHEIEGDSDD